MRCPLLILLFLAAHFPMTAFADTTNHLLQPDVGPLGRIIAVKPVAHGAAPAKRNFRFGNEGGRIDTSRGVVVGRAEDGTEVLVPLTDIAHLTLRFEKDGRVREYDALVDALLTGSTWFPQGRIRKVLLTSGLTIDFDLVGPGVNRDDRTLFWSCKDESVTSLPFEDVALVQVRSNSFVTDMNDLAEYAALTGIELATGERIEVKGLSGMFDRKAGLIRCNGDSIPVTEVRRVEVMDCRGLKEEPVIAVGEPVPAEETVIEAFDFESLELTGKRVKLRDTKNRRKWIQGSVVSQDDRYLVILLDDGPRSVPLEKIEKLKISLGRKNNAGTGALIGGTIVGITGLGLGIAMASDDFFDTSGADVVGVTVVGFATGALIGGAIGSVVKSEKWDEVDKVKIDFHLSPDKKMGLALTLKF